MLELGITELGTVVTYNPWTVFDQTPLAEMVRMLAEEECQYWPVLDSDRQLVGIASEGDVIRYLEVLAAAAAFRGEPSAAMAELSRRCVADIMVHRPVTIDHRASLASLLGTFGEHAIDAVPVLEQGDLVGLVTRLDVLREFSYGQWPGAREGVMEALEPAGDPIESDTTLEEAAIALRLAAARYVGVVRSSFPVGVISDRDLRAARCRATLRQFPDQSWHLPGPASVRELASAAPFIRPGVGLAEAATILLDHNRRAAAVINQAGRLLGAITLDGILRRLEDRLFGR